MDLLQVFKHGDAVLITVFLILVLMSILTWWIIIMRAIKLHKIKHACRGTVEAVATSSNVEDMLRKAKAHPSPLSELTESAVAAARQYRSCSGIPLTTIPLADYLVQHIRNQLTNIKRPLNGGLTVLASVGATAPFIGLLGTVWGIYRALHNISLQGQVNIATVAGPIGEALVATAIGLFAAIPAVLAYNFIVHHNKKVAQVLDTYAYDLHVKLMNDKE